MKGDALLFAGETIYSIGIRAFEDGSPYTHVAIDIGDGQLIEAWPGTGVRGRAIPNDPAITRWRLREPVRDALKFDYAISILKTQLGRPYDVPGIVDVVVARRLMPHDGWFCSELADAFYAWAGLMLEQTDEYVVPARFSREPFVEVLGGDV